MNPINFPESNKELLKPRGMTDEECSSLHVFCNDGYCLSLWKMTFRERLRALLHGRVWVYVLSGQTQPPIALDIKRNVFRQEKTKLGMINYLLVQWLFIRITKWEEDGEKGYGVLFFVLPRTGWNNGFKYIGRERHFKIIRKANL
jgi:hypothetical protein